MRHARRPPRDAVPRPAVGCSRTLDPRPWPALVGRIAGDCSKTGRPSTTRRGSQPRLADQVRQVHTRTGRHTRRTVDLDDLSRTQPGPIAGNEPGRRECRRWPITTSIGPCRCRSRRLRPAPARPIRHIGLPARPPEPHSAGDRPAARLPQSPKTRAGDPRPSRQPPATKTPAADATLRPGESARLAVVPIAGVAASTSRHDALLQRPLELRLNRNLPIVSYRLVC